MSVITLTSQVTYTYVIANTEGPYCETTDKFVVYLTPIPYSGKVLAKLNSIVSRGIEVTIFKKEFSASHTPLTMEKNAISLVENYLKGKNNG